MSIYDDVKAEIEATKPAPPYANRADFTTFFGYAKGVALGSFPSKAAATAAGATLTEPSKDDDAYNAARKLYHDHNVMISAEWKKRVDAEYPDLSEAVMAKIHAHADADGHSAGFSEVEFYIDKYADFARAVIDAASK